MKERFNLVEIKKFTGEDQEVIKEMLGIFLKSVPKTLEEINQAYQNKDHKKFCYFSHKLKSSIDLLSIVELKKDIRLLENCKADQMDSEEISEITHKLNHSLSEILPQVAAST
jgi:HPt (histidine-containing phosphotransfer) domain-containing protein